METNDMMRIGIYICLAVAVLFLIAAILLIFVFGIRGKKKQNADFEKEGVDTSTENPERQTMMGKSEPQPTPDQAVNAEITQEIRTKEGITKTVDGTAPTPVPVADDVKTAEYNAQPAQIGENEAVTQQFGDPGTNVVVQAESVPPAEGVSFEIVKQVIVCDTQEIIE